MNKFKKVYILTPRIKTGGPESLHQLASTLIELGIETYLIYIKTNKDISNLYPQYSNIKIIKECQIEDSSNNLLIVPETFAEYIYKYNNIKKAIWWLSLDYYLLSQINYRTNYILKKYNLHYIFSFLIRGLLILSRKTKIKTFKFGDDKNQIFHFYNCEYVKKFLLENGINEENMLYLCGPISKEYYNAQVNLNIKENIIAYNPAKGYEFTQKIINRAKELNLNINFIPIQNMSTKEVVDLLLKSKLYIDFGYFPGPERIPRQAVLLYNNLITSNIGSASNSIDVTIPDEFKFPIKEDLIDTIIQKILFLLENYESNISLFETYRKKVMDQKKIFIENLIIFFK